ncbi:hypothetical protein J4447_02580 [Candidatus Pacearchaeota archaeon]|nr:hypothetical protein [Candidatus Pacearchaeota archaeon]
MSKKSDIKKIVNILSKALRHKIGSIVNKNELYASKYAKDAEILMREAEKVSLRENWNNHDKINIRKKLERELEIELKRKDFLADEKFSLMEREIEWAMKVIFSEI